MSTRRAHLTMEQRAGRDFAASISPGWVGRETAIGRLPQSWPWPAGGSADALMGPSACQWSRGVYCPCKATFGLQRLVQSTLWHRVACTVDATQTHTNPINGLVGARTFINVTSGPAACAPPAPSSTPSSSLRYPPEPIYKRPESGWAPSRHHPGGRRSWLRSENEHCRTSSSWSLLSSSDLTSSTDTGQPHHLLTSLRVLLPDPRPNPPTHRPPTRTPTRCRPGRPHLRSSCPPGQSTPLPSSSPTGWGIPPTDGASCLNN